jgi:succinyl-diaminopimelate desuccinylase
VRDQLPRSRRSIPEQIPRRHDLEGRDIESTADSSRRATDAVDIEEVIAFAQALVSSASENPPGAEVAVAEVAGQYLKRLGFTVARYNSPAGRPNLVATRGKGIPHLVWQGHLDVVPAGEADQWPYPPFSGILAEGRLWGRGSCDMKGGIASCFGAIAALDRARLTLPGRLDVQLVSDEEAMGKHGASHLFGLGLMRATGCIVGEPTDLRMQFHERGAMWLRARIHGIAAHGSQPHLGVSAILSMAEALLALERSLPDIEHDLLGRPTINVGTIAGGSKVNMVPDLCAIEIDRRTLPSESNLRVLHDVEEAFKACLANHMGAWSEIEVLNQADPMRASPTSRVARAVERAAIEVTRVRPTRSGCLGFTDARFFHQAGTPVVLYGPGTAADAHTSHESIRVDAMVTAARVYASAFVKFLSSV